ncbi:hypothetical protein Scep_001565 [Stephania cephalantha]|uniref:Uncharacterized protein n=1 Tax=Stephania cephalantha TaxID=152367 RepID=A0AAP0Q560_9MAGN
MAEQRAPPPRTSTSRASTSLYKQKSWSSDAYREEAWSRRRDKYKHRSSIKRSKSVTDDDLEELKGCLDLGFGFECSPRLDRKLSDTLPALELYYAVNNSVSSSANSECDDPSSPPHIGSPRIFDLGESPVMVKTRLRQWAQVVACSVRQSGGYDVVVDREVMVPQRTTSLP